VDWEIFLFCFGSWVHGKHILNEEGGWSFFAFNLLKGPYHFFFFVCFKLKVMSFFKGFVKEKKKEIKT
jgi:hypothetical protein